MRDGWEAVIGLEIHVQLATRSKMFSAAATAYGAEPNAQTALLDVAMPGTLPTVNAEAVRMAAAFGLAVGARVAPRSVFARKNYFYPDLPKGYQLSQYELPVVEGGTLRVRCGERVLEVALTRAHLEEDAGKSLHDAFATSTGIDLNRAGTPLLEVVTEPVLESPEQAAATMKALHTLVTWIGICDGNLAEGSFRCDANVSVRRSGDSRLGTRAEIKNVNSFRFVEKAVEYEIERQIRVLEDGGTIVQETRLFDAARGSTRSMRSKESAHDYRYFPDPDLPPLDLPAGLLDRVRDALPELPEARRARYQAEFGLGDYDADLLCQQRALGDYFETAVSTLGGEPKLVANWITSELLARLNETSLGIESAPVGASDLASLLGHVVSGEISARNAKEVFAAMWAGEGTAQSIIAARGLRQVSDTASLVAQIDAVLAQFPEQVGQFRSGNDKVFQFLIGQVMRATRGQANPAVLNALLRDRLTASGN